MIETSASIGLAIAVLSALVASIRLWRGPTTPDRIAALELLGPHGMAIILLYSIWQRTADYLGVVVGLPALGSLGIIALTLFYGRGVNSHGNGR